MALHESLRQLVAARGAGVTADAAEFRAAVDDYLSADEITLGELNLLTDAVRLGAVERLLDLLDQGAGPEDAVRDAGAALARDRGTDDVRSSCWAVAVLGYAVGRLPEPAAPEAAAAGPADDGAEPAPRGRGVPGVLPVALVLLLAVTIGVGAALLWRSVDTDATADGSTPTDDEASEAPTPPGGPLTSEEVLVAIAGDGVSKIYRVDSATGETVPLTQGPDDRLPGLAPDRSTVVYLNGPPEGPFLPVTLDLVTGEPGRLFSVEGPCEHSQRPAWSPSGQRLAVVCTGGDGVADGLYTATADGRNLTPVVMDRLVRGTPTWIDEDTLVYARWDVGVRQSPSSLWQLHIPTGERTELAVATEVPGADLSHPDWSPVHGRLLFLVRPPDPSPGEPPSQLWTVRLDPARPGHVTDPQLVTSGPYDAPVWSPDGSAIALLAPGVPDGAGGIRETRLALLDYPVTGPEPEQETVETTVAGKVNAPVWGSR